MRKLIYFILAILFINFVSAGNLETNNNFTYTAPSGGTFTKNYGGFINMTNVSNSVYIWNGTVGVNYTISAGENWALYQDPTTCVMPYENLNVNTEGQTVILCYGVFGVYDLTANGAIILGKNYTTLDCNGALIFGNKTVNSRGIFSGDRHDVTIKNCRINNFDTGIRGQYYNSTVTNNTLINETGKGIFAETSAHEGLIVNNSITMAQSGTQFTNDILLYYAWNMTVRSNIVSGSYYNIHSYISNYSIIDNNTAFNSSQNGIMIDRGIYNNVTGNYVANATHNCIDINNDYHNVYGNTVTNCKHYSIDMNTEWSGNFGSDNKVFNNLVDGGSNCGGIMVTYYNNTKVFNNTIRNLGFTTNGGCTINAGIQTASNGTQTHGFNNWFFNNTISNISNYCIFSQGINSTFESNNISDCGIADILIQNLIAGQYTTDRFINNHFLNQTVYYKVPNPIAGITDELVNFSINEISSNHHLINLSFNDSIKFNYNGRKDLNVHNHTITINSLTTPYNDIKNISNGVLLAVNQDSYSIILQPNQQVEVGDFAKDISVTSESISINDLLNGKENLTFVFTVDNFNSTNTSACWLVHPEGQTSCSKSTVLNYSKAPSQDLKTEFFIYQGDQQYYGFITKFDISTIPANAVIVSAKYYNYLASVGDSFPATSARILTTTNQNWNEGTSAATIRGLTYDAETIKSWSSTDADTWSSLDVTSQLQWNINQNKTNLTLKIYPYTYFNLDEFGNPIYITDSMADEYNVYDDFRLIYAANEYYATFNDREDTLANGNTPYLLVSYVVPGTVNNSVSEVMCICNPVVNQSSTMSFTPKANDTTNTITTGTNYTGVRIDFDYVADPSQINTLSSQYFLKKYNLTSGIGSGTVLFQGSNSESARSVDLVNGTLIQDQSSAFSGDFIKDESDWTISGTTFVVDSAYNIVRTFYYNNTLSKSLPQILIQIPLGNYSASELAEQQDGITWPDLGSTMSGSTIAFNLSAVNNASSQQYRYSYDALLVQWAGDSVADVRLSGSQKLWTYRGNFIANFDMTGKTAIQTIPKSIFSEFGSRTANYTTQLTDINQELYPYVLIDSTDQLDLSFDPLTDYYPFILTYYTPISGNPGGGSPGGGGGSGKPNEVIVEVGTGANGTIDWGGLNGYSLTLFSVPTKRYKEVLITALNGPVEGELKISSNLVPYFYDFGVCDVSGADCSTTVSMKANEKKRLFLRSEFSGSFADLLMSQNGGVIGDVSILNKFSKQTWPIIVDKGGFFDQSREISLNTGLDMSIIAFVLFGGLIAILLAIAGYIILQVK